MTQTQPIADLATLLSALRPVLQPGRHAFVALPADATFDMSLAIASIREPEGLSVIVPERVADELGLPVAFTAAWITLTVYSELSAIGLTAAFSTALAQAGVGCNVVAGTRHDHVFVPCGQARRAMEVLAALQQSATG